MKEKEGSILIIVIVLTTIMLGVGITIFSIIEKEIKSQIYTERSKEAFLIADSAWECTLYNDFRRLTFDLNNIRTNRILDCGDELEIFENKEDGSLDEEYVINSGLGKRSEVFEITPKVAEFNFVVQNRKRGSRNPCAEVKLRKYCVRSAADSSVCDSSINQIENELTVIGYGACGEGVSGERPSRGDILRRFTIRY